jgi:hypothetical protein
MTTLDEERRTVVCDTTPNGAPLELLERCSTVRGTDEDRLVPTPIATRTSRAAHDRRALRRPAPVGIAFELAFAATVIYLPPLQSVFGTASLSAWILRCLSLRRARLG